MNHRQFLEKLRELLEREDPLTGPEPLSGLKEWDSLAVVGFMAMADRDFGVMVNPNDIEACKTVNDIAALIDLAE